ncbi:MAG: MFS transporter [Myxococcaceae bacterium]
MAKITLLLVSTLAILSFAVITPSLPAMRDAFAGVRHVGLLTRLVLAFPALFIVLAAPWAGVIADRFGRRPLLLGAMGLYAIAGTSGVWAPRLSVILVGRALLGVAIAGTMTAATTLITDLTTGRSRRRLLGEQAAVIGIASAVFVVAGGILADLHWRTPFLLYALALLLVLPVLGFVREPLARRKRVRRGNAHLPVRALAPSWATMLTAQVVFFLSPVLVPFLLRDLGALQATRSGVAVALLGLLYAAGALCAEPASSRVRTDQLFFAAFSLLGVGYLWIAVQRSWVGVLPGMAFAGFGLGLLVPNVLAQVAERAPEAVRGRAMGSITTAIFLGQFLAPILFAPVTSGWGNAASFGVAGGVSLLAGAVILLRVR